MTAISISTRCRWSGPRRLSLSEREFDVSEKPALKKQAVFASQTMRYGAGQR